MDAIFKRRSVRKFTQEPVSDADITQLLKAGMRAPSAGHEQPWEFIVIQDRKTLDSIPDYHPYAAMLKGAPLAIVVCGDLDRQKYPDSFWVQDCSAATQNILLEAVHLGLGAVWVSCYPVKDRVENTSKLLGLPQNVVPLCIIPVGHASETPAPLDTFDESRIHHDTWGGTR